MLDLTKTTLPIEHTTSKIPGIMRFEVYKLGEMVYSEQYDDLNDHFIDGKIKMYDDIYVCTVYPGGLIQLNMPTGWVTNHKSMMQLMDDLKQLDEFLSFISDQYNK